MAMTGPNLATALKNAIGAIAADQRSFDAVWNAIGAALVTYITTNATVTVTGTATGVTAGAASAPVAGTGTVS